MAYDERLAQRIRAALGQQAGITEKEMFGGVAFLLRGKMFVGILKDELMARVGPERDAEALDRPHVRPMDFTGRVMKGYVFVEPEGLRGGALRHWIDWSLEFVATLPAKQPARASAKKPAARAKAPRAKAERRTK